MSQTRVVIVGAGSMAGVHADALSRIPGVSLAGIAALDFPKAKALAARHHTTAFRTLTEALKGSRPDAAFVCVPTPFHRAVVLEAAAAGLHVFSEKPLALTLRDGDAMLKAVRRAKVKLMVGHVLRFFPEFIALRNLVARGSLGNLSVARLSRGGKMPQGLGNWYADWKKSGGPLLDLVIHDFDWLRWTFGPVERVHARAAAPSKGLPQAYTLTLLRFKRGPIAHVEGFWGHDLPFRVTVELAGSKGLASYDSSNPVALSLHQAGARPGLPAVAVPESPVAISPYQAEDEHFIASIRNNTEPAVTGEDAYEAMRIGLAALTSARTGKAVRL
jgi:predicted dehydrogenase